MRHHAAMSAGRIGRATVAVGLTALLAGCATASGPDTAGGADAASCPAALSAPPSATDWLPASPAIDVGDRLLPDAEPVTAVVCEYPGADDDLTLGRHTASPGGDDAVTTLRAALADPNGAAGGAGLCPRQHARYLARFDYPGGSVWVGTAPCSTTNGENTRTRDSQAAFSTALDALVGPVATTDDPEGGTAAPTGAPPTDDPFGRYGDPAFDACLNTSPSYDEVIAPAAPEFADVCHKPASGRPATSVTHGAADAARLSAALRALPTVDPSTCRTDDDQWLVDFRTADDLDAAVFVDAGCRTAVGDGGTTVQLDDAFLTLLRGLD